MRNSDSDTALPGFERSLAVVIGINSYSHGIPPLLNAVRDATAVADSLERQGFEVLRLLDAEATLSSLSHLLSHHLPSLESPPDRLLIYFAGHGLAHTDDEHQLSGFLLPSDARRDDTSSYWPMAALREALSHLPCRHLLLILDCCFAGAFPHSPSRDIRAPSVPAPLYLERFRHFSSRRSFQLLLSTAHDELASDRLLAKPSQESLGDGLHSPFALALLQGLQPLSPADSNQDGLLTAAELYTFLRDRLLSLVPSHCQQTPSLWHLDWHDGGEFLFLLSDSFPSLPPAAPLSQRSNPYLGLRPFSSAQRHLFFGRERLVDSLLERLRTQPLLLLCGPSGAGKSSLVHAGLLPRLTEDPSWRVPPSLRPSSQPFHGLSSWLASLAPETAAPSAADLASRPRSAAEFLGSFLVRHPERSVLLVIDPLEEIVTSCLDDTLRRAFLRALSGLLQLSHPRLHLLLLLRSDFEPHFLALLQPCAIPSSLWHGGRLNLQPMNRDELRRCIEKPAEACVLFFSPGLIERLLDDVEQMPGALPLLSVALSELFGAYLSSGRNDRTLCFEDYHHIGGGIAGALQRRAELVFSGTPPPLSEGQPALPPVPASELPAFQRTLRNVLLRMVAPEGGELARRRVPRSELEYPHREENTRVQRVLRTLEASRLVVASDDGGPCIEPAHDALLSAWPRLHDWARHAQRELLLLRRVSHAASEWHRHRHTADFLWADARLDQLDLVPASLRRTDVPLALPTTSPGNQPTEPLALNASESGFLRASATRRRFLRARRNALALTVAVTLVALTVAALFQANKANDSATQAELQQRAAEVNAKEARKQKEAAETNAQEAQTQEQRAKANASEAQRQQKTAEANAREAQRQKETADTNAREAQRQQQAAEANSREAQKQQQLADASTREARKQQESADANAREAQRQQESAEANSREAQKQQQLADANAREARKQQESADANYREARKQQETADANAREAERQQEAAQTNAQEARMQQQLAEANARDAERQQEIAQANAQEARMQQQLAEVNAREAERQQEIAQANASEALEQKELALASARHTHIERLLQEDPTRALLILLDGSSWPESPDDSWLQTALNISQLAISHAILAGHTSEITDSEFSPDGSRVLTASDDGTVRIWRTDGSGVPIVLPGHTNGVASAILSPDGSHILTVSGDGTARIWRADRSSIPITLEIPMSRVTSATFSPDGLRIVTASNDGTARIWRADGSSILHVLAGHTPGATFAKFSPDGAHVLTVSSDDTPRIWSSDGSNIPTDLDDSEVRDPDFSPDGSLVLALTPYGSAILWRTDGSGDPILFGGTTGLVTFATFSPDGSHILTTSQDGAIRIWRIDDSGVSFVVEEHTGGVITATFSPDGSSVLTTAQDGAARIWRVDGSEDTSVLKVDRGIVVSAKYSPDGFRLLTTSSDGTVRIWRADGSSILHVFTGHSSVACATFSADGSRVLTVSGNTARIWRIDGSNTLLLDGQLDWVRSATLSPDGSGVLAASWNGDVRILSTDGSGALINLEGHNAWVNSATFSPDGSRVLTASADETARISHADGSGTPIELKSHTGWVLSATFSPDGSRVLTTSAGGTTGIWRIDGSDATLDFEGHTGPVHSATFSLDGSHVLTIADDDRTAHIWRTDSSSRSFVLDSHLDGEVPFYFSPDGSRVITASDDGMVHIWRIDGSEAPLELEGHTGPVRSATFSPDGSRVFTAAYDGTVRIWNVDSPGTPLILTEYVSTARIATFSPDSTRILIGSEDDTARIWRVGEHVPFLTLQHENIFRAFFLPSGSQVVTLSDKGILRRWPIDPILLHKYLRNATTACLSADERERYLFESPDEARERHEGCERAHDRLP